MNNILPPLTTADFSQQLSDTSRTVYLYVGTEIDEGWTVAQVACGQMTFVEAFLAQDTTLVAQWLNDSSVPGCVSGVVPAAVAFDWQGKPALYLPSPSADVLEVVRKAILKAQSPTSATGQSGGTP